MEKRYTQPLISVVIPVYSERENLTPLHVELIDALSHIHGSKEIIYVDDASSDGSQSIIQKFVKQNTSVHPVFLMKHAGQTIALQKGIQKAKGEYIVTMDADLQNDPNDIPALFHAIKKGYDAVCGIRQQRKDRLLIKIYSYIGYWIRQLLFADGILDSGCTLRIYRSDIIKRIKLNAGYHRFIPTLLFSKGYRIAQIPVHHRRRQYGRSKYTLFKIFPAVRDIIMLKRTT